MIAQMIRAILFASATAATMRGLRPTSLPSQLSGMTPLRMIQRILLMAPTISSLRMSVCPILLTPPSRVLPPVDLCLGTRPSQAAKFLPLEKVSQIGREGHHRTSRHRPNARHRAQTAHLDILLRCIPQSEGQFVDLRRKQIDLIKVEPSNLPDRVRHLGCPVVQLVSNLLEMGRPLWKDQTELGQVTPQRIDQLGALANEALVGSERHGAGLMFGALDRPRSACSGATQLRRSPRHRPRRSSLVAALGASRF